MYRSPCGRAAREVDGTGRPAEPVAAGVLDPQRDGWVTVRGADSLVVMSWRKACSMGPRVAVSKLAKAVSGGVLDIVHDWSGSGDQGMPGVRGSDEAGTPVGGWRAAGVVLDAHRLGAAAKTCTVSPAGGRHSSGTVVPPPPIRPRYARGSAKDAPRARG